MDTLPESASDPVTGGAQPAPHGVVELICGCMFSGKTTRLLQQLQDAPAQAILIVKHDKDDRYSRSQVMTHNGAGCPAVCVHSADDILNQVASATEVVAIDEGHFYDERLADVCAELARRGKRVIVTALDLDMWGRPFEVVERLKQVADVVSVQQARCAVCQQPATHTYRKTLIVGHRLVGGPEDFEPRCRSCWSPPPEAPIAASEME